MRMYMQFYQALFSGSCKSWTVDFGLDYGLDFGLDFTAAI